MSISLNSKWVHGDTVDLGTTIKHTAGKGALFSYGARGCYCGVGGRESPKDATDCQKYLDIEDRTYFKCQWCKCDQIAIICFARNMKTYNKKLQYYSNCRWSTPKCLRSP
ncbi:phospholipase A2, membrane associated-like [Capricornis sumatraensis]|uniref:phospholipase A2, membrane associated-like n=1 Tax=Capricornis sumatraensis TaxID=34865 RepID=UPI0036043350